MGLRSFFHKIKIGFMRMGESSIPYTTQAKKYGDWGEDKFIYAIQSRLPNCKLKKNIIIQTADGNAEIDCLILYKNKLFAIEVKRWKGHLVERDGDFIQYKRDRWTGETHTKLHKSPFKQIGRAIYLLRKENPENSWINSIVFFEEADRIETDSDNVWFDDIDALIYHVQNEGQASWGNTAEKFFDRCIAADYLYCNSWGKSLHCIIRDESLRFTTPERVLTRKDIDSISIVHHWSYDDLTIKTVSGRVYNVMRENDHVIVNENGHKYRYALCKLDFIQLG
ncbi:MAG: NERD domain-containing protein [Ruminococcaceae bacterium]|nr:NERD domain-containing protein [Oscillospiraceae bacterium]